MNDELPELILTDYSYCYLFCITLWKWVLRIKQRPPQILLGCAALIWLPIPITVVAPPPLSQKNRKLLGIYRTTAISKWCRNRWIIVAYRSLRTVHGWDLSSPMVSAESIQWFINDQTFSPSHDLAPPLPTLPAVSHRVRLVNRDNLLTEEGGGGSQITRRWESLVLYNHSILSGL